MFSRISDFKRLLWSQPNQSVVKCQPVFGKHADVDIDANRCASDADRVCAVLQHVRHGHLLLFSRESERAASHVFRDRDPLPFGQQKNWIDCVWIVDVVGCDPGSIRGATRLRGQHLIKKAAFFDVTGKDFSFINVLITNGGCEIFPARILRIGGRIIWIGRNVTCATGDTDAIRTNQLVVVVISRIVHETIAVPFFACLVVEVRIWKKPETEYPGWFAVNSLIDARRLPFYLVIEPQAKFIRLGRGAKPRLVHQAQGLETLGARKFAAIQHL